MKALLIIFLALPAAAQMPQQAADLAVMENDEFLYNRIQKVSSALTSFATLEDTQTFTGGNTFASTTTFLKQVTISTGLAVSGQVDFIGDLNISTVNITTEVIFSSSTPSGITGKGVLYYDDTLGVFMVKENAGAAKPIVDPPGNWTCTIRNAQSLCVVTAVNQVVTSTSTCVGNEKLLGWSGSANTYTNATCAVLMPTAEYEYFREAGAAFVDQSVYVSYILRNTAYSLVKSYANCCK